MHRVRWIGTDIGDGKPSKVKFSHLLGVDEALDLGRVHRVGLDLLHLAIFVRLAKTAAIYCQLRFGE